MIALFDRFGAWCGRRLRAFGVLRGLMALAGGLLLALIMTLVALLVSATLAIGRLL